MLCTRKLVVFSLRTALGSSLPFIFSSAGSKENIFLKKKGSLNIHTVQITMPNSSRLEVINPCYPGGFILPSILPPSIFPHWIHPS